ncbi:uncharacterized protein L3040_003886 [Drepanopeziza brunnea f. sp. 'multigermtubi']|uniref:uncharacterized protein n=1 Tax=Drepanopeziza brunnea f. sp. 'multigermtubi' TaxID=698441 RepID=UPI00238EE5CC|nr:hypothetical protein L3040_003886 [Drepanopeziza brunnea f. sp. 'multigermtubi']
MSTPSTRLTFLYPHFFRAARLSESSGAAPSILLHGRTRTWTPQLPFKASRKGRGGSGSGNGIIGRRGRSLFTAARRRQERFVQRHGKAVEPFLADGERSDGVKVYTPEAVGESNDGKDGKVVLKNAPELQKEVGGKGKGKGKGKGTERVEPLSEETQAAARVPSEEGVSLPGGGAQAKVDGREGKGGDVQGKEKGTGEQQGPTDTVLHMPPPETVEEENAGKPPHLQTPPYVHHFDTYTLVQQVEAGGFTEAQSVTAMKAVRGLLALNLEMARRGLVSKSDVENETYLFRAACSELKTEIQNTRKKDEETMRRERTLLQHEVDILNQKLTQELLTLKDDLKGMFDDRKMSVRSEQRTMDSKIQELNYKITVLLNSDSKSEIEGLRWVLTRRSVMGILFMAFMVLTSLRYASYKSHEDEMRMKKKEEVVAKGGVGGPEGDLPVQVSAAEILTAN